MKRIIKIFSLVFVIALASTTNASEKQLDKATFLDIKNVVLQPFFAALKNGDVKKIKDYLSEDFYNSYQVLLEKNKGYPKFLRDYYREAKFDPITVVQLDDTVIVNVEIVFPDGTISYMDLNLKNSVHEESENSNERTWKIDRSAKRKREHIIENK